MGSHLLRLAFSILLTSCQLVLLHLTLLSVIVRKGMSVSVCLPVSHLSFKILGKGTDWSSLGHMSLPVSAQGGEWRWICKKMEKNHSGWESSFSQEGTVMGEQYMSTTNGHSFNTRSHTMGYYGCYPTQTNPIGFAGQKWLSPLDRWGNWCQRGKAGSEVTQLSSRVRIQMLIFWIQISDHEKRLKILLNFQRQIQSCFV